MAGLVVHLGHEPEAAVVFFKFGAVEAVLVRCCVHAGRAFQMIRKLFPFVSTDNHLARTLTGDSCGQKG
jgi:hypothetical protein